LEDAPIGIYRVTFESLGEKTVGRFASVNSALVSLLGYSTAAELMSSVEDIADEIYADLTQYSQFVGLLKDVGQVTGFEYQGYRQSGDLIWISQSAWAIRDGRGALVGYEGILEEVTERKLAELTLAQTVEDLKKEIFHLQQVQQAADIVQTDYFQKLRSNGEEEKPQTVAPKANLPTRVLLVEDNELNRDMLSRRLKRANYEVSVAMDGAEGTDKAMQELPDIILMDISLPVMDGWEATQRLKQDPQTAKIPIIALTAHAMAGDREKSLAAGCDDYDTKPIDLSRLLSKIEGCLQCSTG
ncbi:MAG: response regulator, partial [Cyanobacteria bacterium J06642_2]